MTHGETPSASPAAKLFESSNLDSALLIEETEQILISFPHKKNVHGENSTLGNDTRCHITNHDGKTTSPIWSRLRVEGIYFFKEEKEKHKKV